MIRVLAAIAVVTLALLTTVPAAQEGFTPVTDRMLQNPDPADWLMWRRTLNSWGFSPLDQINRGNVRTLTLVWTRAMTPGVQEATPLVHDGVMYLPNPSDVVQAMNAATGDLKWEYRRKLPDDLQKFFPVPAINRNLAIFGNLIIDTSADDYVYALDATTGTLAWETKILEYQRGAQQTSGPIIANGKIISGRGCEPEGGPEACVITAHDAKTGRELWRARTIPGPGEPGNETWGSVPYDQRKHVGTWMVPSFDPELNLIYVGTSVTSPAPKYLLGGNNLKYLYHNCTLALDADTGKIVWYYQHIVDHWDLDHPFERLLVDTVVAPNPREVMWINPRIKPGGKRKVVTGIPGKTGVVYTLDRQTGEFLWARPTVMQTVLAGIDETTGQPTVNPDVIFNGPNEEKLVCPNPNGGKNWAAGAYSPVTNTMYYPLQNTCMMATATQAELNTDVTYALRNRVQLAPGEENVGVIEAISVATGQTVWKHEQRAGTLSLMSTAGGLLFGGDVNGRFRAYDVRSGEILWEINLGAPVNGYPATFAVAGKQYVAVSTGGSGLALGLGRLAPEQKPGNGNQLFVFALP
jgi:alcohol dehydrogenase (cytochrome c)